MLYCPIPDGDDHVTEGCMKYAGSSLMQSQTTESASGAGGGRGGEAVPPHPKCSHEQVAQFDVSPGEGTSHSCPPLAGK